jgi:hypothetical protein
MIKQKTFEGDCADQDACKWLWFLSKTMRIKRVVIETKTAKASNIWKRDSYDI